MLAAILWDVDGTLAETERDGHRVAFNKSFAAHGLPWRWDERRYGELLAVTGGRERLLHDMEAQPDAPGGAEARAVLAASLHRAKNGFYAGLVNGGGVALRPGVRELLDDCARAGMRMGIVTTTSRSNIDALLRTQLGPGWHAWFEVVVAGEDVARKKPHPEAYCMALAQLRLHPEEALAIEDSPAGVRAASAAGVPVVMTRSHYFDAASAGAALASGPALDSLRGWVPHTGARDGRRVGLAQLRTWHSHSRR